MYKQLSDGAETCIKSQNERFSAYQRDSRLLAMETLAVLRSIVSGVIFNK